MTPKRRALLTAIKTADLTVVTTVFIVTVIASLANATGSDWRAAFEVRIAIQNAIFVGLYLVFWHFVLRWFGLYRSYRLAPASREIRDTAGAVMVAVAPLVPLGLALDFEYVTVGFLLTFGLTTFVCLQLGRNVLRAIARRLRARGRNLRNVMVIGHGDAAVQTCSDLARQEDLGYRVVEVMDLYAFEGGSTPETEERILEHIEEVIDQHPVDEVFVAVRLDASHPVIPAIISCCEDQGIMVRVLVGVADLSWGKALVDEVGGKPVLTIYTGTPDTMRFLVKRAIDVVGAGVGILALSPLFLLAALAIWYDTGRPVFYSQERVGYNRRRFRIHKFRTMVPNADQIQAELEDRNEADGPVFKIREDPRITHVGAWLRRTSIDELPQLFNVLRGDMSLVGPRPLPVRDVNRIDVRWHNRRFSVKPGITCIWQAYSREPSFEEWIRSDMEYIDSWSLTLDFKILLRTIPAVLLGQGAH